MAPENVATIIQELIRLARHDLERAAGLALAAEACAERGVISDAIQIANEIDDPAHDVDRLLSVVALISRKYLPARAASSEEEDASDE